MALYTNKNYKTCDSCQGTFFVKSEILQYEVTSGNNLATGEQEYKEVKVGNLVSCYNCGKQEVQYD